MKTEKKQGLVFGLNIGDLLGTYDRNLQSWRTSVLLLFEDSTQFLDRLPKSGIMLNGRIYAQENSVETLPGTEFLLLPTPSASNMSKGSSTKRYLGSPYYKGNLSEAIRDSENDPIYPNPDFVENLMMYPIKWTDLKDSEMQLYLK